MYKFDNGRLIISFKPGVLDEEWREFTTIMNNGIELEVDGKYMISTEGRVTRNGVTVRCKFPSNPKKYPSIWIKVFMNDVSVYKNIGLHILVARAFIPNPDNKPQVNHRDGIKNNPQVTNLEWVTIKENVIHSFATGLNVALKEEDHNGATFTNDQVHEICKKLEKGLTVREVCTTLPFLTYTKKNRDKIKKIRSGSNWSTISSQYTFENRSTSPLLSDEDVHSICKYIIEGKSNSSIRDLIPKLNKAKRPLEIIRRIRRKKRYKNISDLYF